MRNSSNEFSRPRLHMQRRRTTNRFAIYAMGILLGAIALRAAADSPTAATDPAAAVEPADAATPAPAQKPKVICKSEKVTGSSIRKRTCRTETQAAQDHRTSQEYLNRI